MIFPKNNGVPFSATDRRDVENMEIHYFMLLQPSPKLANEHVLWLKKHQKRHPKRNEVSNVRFKSKNCRFTGLQEVTSSLPLPIFQSADEIIFSAYI